MPVSPIANTAKSNAESAAICAVIVVPMFAPIVMVVACVRVMTPALTSPTTMTVVSEELCMTAVTAVPMPTPTRFEDHSFVFARNFSLRVAPSGRVTLPEARWKSERILPVASFSMLSESSLTPMRKAPRPASSSNTAYAYSIVHRYPSFFGPGRSRPVWREPASPRKFPFILF